MGQTGLQSPDLESSHAAIRITQTGQPRRLRQKWLLLRDRPAVSLPAFRFPNLFPPLKPETVARRTVEAVQLNQALLLLPWTMHALIILKR